MATASWITSLTSATSSAIQSPAEWLRFIFLSPCPQRPLFSAIDLVLLLVLFYFAFQKLCSRIGSPGPSDSSIEKTLPESKRNYLRTTLWFKLFLILTLLLAISYIILCILAFTRSAESSWKTPEGVFTANPSRDTLNYRCFDCSREEISVSSSSVMEHVQLLHGVEDEFGGVIVDMKDPLNSEVFVATLRASISKWRQEGKKGIWMKLPIELVNLVEATVKEGFYYHHAEPKYLMLVYWIPETPSTIPANASHRVGVGACVINDKREILVVQEKSGRFRATGVWKFPTGSVDEGEDIFKAAVREVKEETGIDAEFVEVLAFRQSHKSFFGKSDLLFVSMLRPLSFNIKKQDVEIEAAQWMPIEDYAAQPYVQEHKLAKFFADICIAKIDKGYAGFSSVITTSGFGEKPITLYLNSRDLN